MSDSPCEPCDDQMADDLRLDQFLQLAGIAGTGGQAKMLIQAGMVTVNGETELRRRRKLHRGDVVVFEGEQFVPDEYVRPE